MQSNEKLKEIKRKKNQALYIYKISVENYKLSLRLVLCETIENNRLFLNKIINCMVKLL